MHLIPVRTVRQCLGWLGRAALALLLGVTAAKVATAADLTATQQIFESGRVRSFEVAINELSVRTAGHGLVPQEVNGLATAEAVRLHAQLLAQTTGAEVELVLYEAGRPRDQFTRRVLTRQVLAHLAPGTDPAVVAGLSGSVAKGGLSYAPGFHLFEAPAVGGSLALAATLQGMAGVHSAEPVMARQFAKMLVPNDTLFTNQWHLVNTGQNAALLGVDINVTNVWDTFRGSGVTIGIVDDGLQGAHPDLTNNYNFSLGLDVNDGDFDPSPNVLSDFHGTAVAGVAAARGNNGLGVAGVAFEATLAGIRFLGGPATDVQIAQCLTHSNQVIQVYNNSWGAAFAFFDLFVLPSAISNALANGAQTGRGGRGSIFVFSAGNSAQFGDNANYSGLVNSIYTIGVGALNDRFQRASYSTPGAPLVISAPAGNDATRPQGTSTTDLVGTDGYNSGTPTDPLEYAGNPDYTARFNGTSSAAPVVSGVVALMLQANPNLGWRDVQEILIRSAAFNDTNHVDWRTNGAGFRFNHDYGAGLVNAGGAVALASTWTNLGPQFPFATQQSNLALPIPDNNTNGVLVTFNVSNANVRIEHVILTANISHTYRGDLAVELVSPSGTVSRLAELHNDSNRNYTDWAFMSVRHWGELAEGTWTVRVSDRAPVDVGTLNSLELRCIGSFTNSSGTATNPPSITAQPRSRTVTQGSTVNFSVGVASNASQPVRYQWRYNGTDILGAVSPFLTLTNVQAGAGGLYSVLIANPLQTNVSADAALFVNAPPVVFAHPQPQSVIVGSNATLTVAATGTAPFTYQWRFNGAPISGANSQTYSIPSVQSSQAGSYDVLVGNALASVFSSNASLAVLPPFSLTPQPVSRAVAAGSNATFNVGAVGLGAFTGPFTFQWLLDGNPLPGQTNLTLSLTNVALNQSGNYACLVSSPLGNLTSTNGQLTVFNPFALGTANFQLGGLFQITASGDNGRSYRLESSTNLVNWVPVVTNVVSGGSATFTDSGATSQTRRFYRIVLLP